MVTCYYEDGHAFARLLGDLTMLNINSVVGNIERFAEENDCWQIVLDFSEVPVVDSAAIGSLVKLSRQAQGNNGYTLLVHPNAHFMEVLYYSKLDKTLRPFSTVEKALEYARHGDPPPPEEVKAEPAKPRH